MHRCREMRKAMRAIVVVFRGGCAPEDPRPEGVGLFWRRAAPNERAQTFGYARARSEPLCIQNRPIHSKDILETMY